MAVLILISCRPLERQLGAAKFAVSSTQCLFGGRYVRELTTSSLQHRLFSSVVGGVVLSVSVYVGAKYHTPLPLPSGALLLAKV